MQLGGLLFQTHGAGVRRILDVGSRDINGSLREVCPAGAQYIGIDLEAGNGVDLVLADPYRYPFPDGHFDMVVSTTAFEHDPMFWLTFVEMIRVVRDGGIVYINAPSNGHYHGHPLDHWRFYPDASVALEKWGQRSGYVVQAVESFTMTRSGPWNDYVMLFCKGGVSPAQFGFLSDCVPGVTNLRKFTHPNEILFRREETDDLLHMAQLHQRVVELEAALAARQSDPQPVARVAAASTPPPLTGIGIVDANALVSGNRQGNLIDAMPIAAAGSVPRRRPVLIDSRAVPAELRSRLDETFAQENSVWHPLHRLELADALLVGQGSVLVPGDGRYQLLWDSAREFLAQHRVPDGMEREHECFSVRSSIRRRIEDHCLLLKRPWYSNFGHWLVDQAMVLSYLAHRHALPTTYVVIGRVEQPRMRRIMSEMLAAILPNVMVLEHPDEEVWQFRHLSYVMPLHVPPLFKLPAALDHLREDMLAVPVANIPRPRRLHIVRRGELRRLTNEPDILRISARYGFEPVCPEERSMAEQAALFSQAEAVLGVKGAAMTNIVFAHADCRVMLMSPSDFIDPFYWDIASTRGMAYAELFGAVTTRRGSPDHDDFEIAPADVAAAIEQMLATVPA